MSTEQEKFFKNANLIIKLFFGFWLLLFFLMFISSCLSSYNERVNNELMLK